MTKATEVALYILDYCKNNKIKDCSNKKLQKLLYYVQAWSLALTGNPVFSDKIEAWLHGPVVRNVYRKYKDFAYEPILFNEDCPKNLFDEKQKKTVEMILKAYSKYDADFLEMRTHIEEPWLKARQDDTEIITNESMMNYYKSVHNNGK